MLLADITDGPDTILAVTVTNPVVSGERREEGRKAGTVITDSTPRIQARWCCG